MPDERSTRPPLETLTWGDPQTFAIRFEPTDHPLLVGYAHGGETSVCLAGRWLEGDRNDSVCCTKSDMEWLLERASWGWLDAHPAFFSSPPKPFARAINNAVYQWRSTWSDDETDDWNTIGNCHHAMILRGDSRSSSWRVSAARQRETLRLVAAKFRYLGRCCQSRLVGEPVDIRLPWSLVEKVALEYLDFFNRTPLQPGSEPGAAQGFPAFQPRERPSYEIPPLPDRWGSPRV